jgi:hypothetical protein
MLERGLGGARRAAAAVRVLSREGAERVPESGAVQSAQEAEVVLPRGVLERLWRPEYLERLAGAYWRFLSRISLGLVRVLYEPDARTIVFGSRRLALLRFHAPEYETSPDSGRVTWRIERGLLVAREGRGRGYLRIRVRRGAAEPASSAPPTAVLEPRATVNVRVEVRNFYPWLRGSGRFARFGTWLYAQTQLRIHVIVCNAFLRSLARLDLPPSRVGAMRGEGDGGRSV